MDVLRVAGLARRRRLAASALGVAVEGRFAELVEEDARSKVEIVAAARSVLRQVAERAALPTDAHRLAALG
jgi:hypothetical protein